MESSGDPSWATCPIWKRCGKRKESGRGRGRGVHESVHSERGQQSESTPFVLERSERNDCDIEFTHANTLHTHTHTHTRARAHTPPSPMPNDHAHSPPSAPGDHLPPGTARWVSSTRRRTSRSGSSAAPPTTPSSSAPTQESSRTPRRRHSTSAHSERSRCGTTCTHLRRDPFRSPPWTDNIFLLWTPAPLSVIGFSIGYTNTLSTYLSPAAPRPRSPA